MPAPARAGTRIKRRYAGLAAGEMEAREALRARSRSVASRCRRLARDAADRDADAVIRFQRARHTHWAARAVHRVTSKRLHEDVALLMLLPLTGVFLAVGARALWSLWMAYAAAEGLRRIVAAKPPFATLAPHVLPLTGVDTPLGAAPRSSIVFASTLAYLLTTRAPALHPFWKAAAWLFVALLAASRVLAGQLFLRQLFVTLLAAAVLAPAAAAAADTFHAAASSRLRFLVALLGLALSFSVHLLRIEENRSRLVGTTRREFLAVLGGILGSDGPAGASFRAADLLPLTEDSDEDDEDTDGGGGGGGGGGSDGESGPQASVDRNRAATLRMLQYAARAPPSGRGEALERALSRAREPQRRLRGRAPRDSFVQLMRSMERRAAIRDSRDARPADFLVGGAGLDPVPSL